MVEKVAHRNQAGELSGARFVDGEVEVSWAGQRSVSRFSRAGA